MYYNKLQMGELNKAFLFLDYSQFPQVLIMFHGIGTHVLDLSNQRKPKPWSRRVMRRYSTVKCA